MADRPTHPLVSEEHIRLLVKLAGDLHDEAARCAAANCWRAALLLIGSTLEATLTATAGRLESELRTGGHWPADKRLPQRWDFDVLVRLAIDARWLPSVTPSQINAKRSDILALLEGDVGDAVRFVQRIRNMVAHPGRYVIEKVRPEFDDAEHMRVTYELVDGIAAHVFERLSAALNA